MKLSIRGRMLLLASSGVLATFFALGAVALYGLRSAQEIAWEKSGTLEALLTESMGSYAESQAKARLREVVEAKAMHMDSEFSAVAQDTELLADCLSRILSRPENYLPRRLPNTREAADLLPGVTYLHYSPELLRQGVGDALEAEIGAAGNFADVLEPMSKSYAGYRVSFFVGSERGYFLGLDMIPEKDGAVGIFPTEEAREEFVSGYDPRSRPWYRLGRTADRPVFTDPYRGADGLLNVTCVMPYRDRDGIAGVMGISYGVDTGTDASGASQFILNAHGNVLLSTENEGILAVTEESRDLRETAEPSVAEAARRMVAGESGVMTVTMQDGDVFYLAFAPLPSIGWSLGSVIDAKDVREPVEQAGLAVRKEMDSFPGTLQQDFLDTSAKAGLLLLPVLLLLLYLSGLMASRLARPIRTLAENVKEISAGNFDKKLEIRTGDEVEHLADCFNAMTEELKGYMRQLARTAAEQERSRTELEVAAKIQADMLPKGFPAFPERQEFDLFATMDAAKDVGGDFYDFYLADENHLVLAIADVSGKGVPAALFMARSQSILKNCVLMARNGRDDLGAVLENANRQLCEGNDAAMFVTVFLGLLDLCTGHFSYADGGHCPPLLGRAGSYGFLPMEKGSMLGLMDLPYETQSIDLLPGDTLFLYTDGVSEAMDEKGRQFTEPRIRDTLDALGEQSMEGMLMKMREQIRRHAGDAQQSDDITMLGLRWNAPRSLPQKVYEH